MPQGHLVDVLVGEIGVLKQRIATLRRMRSLARKL
jgi:hypothetical protein